MAEKVKRGEDRKKMGWRAEIVKCCVYSPLISDNSHQMSVNCCYKFAVNLEIFKKSTVMFLSFLMVIFM